MCIRDSPSEMRGRVETKEDALTSSAKPTRKSPVPSDIEIAQAATMQPIQAIAEKAGILEDELELYGRYKAKIDYMGLLARLKDKPDGKIINVTAITPTPLGEGKTVTAIGPVSYTHLRAHETV